MDIASFNRLRQILEQNKKFVITKENLGEKSLELTNNFMQYYDQYIVEYKVLQDMLTSKQKLYSELYNKYRYDNKLEARTKTEVEPFIYSDESYYKMSLAVNDQEMIVKYFEGLCDMIKRLSYNIKNIIELKNLGMQV
jgi:hypothetical protein